MDTIGWDINLDIKLLSFDRSETLQKSQIVLEQGRQVPAKIEFFFIEKAKAQYGGFVHISLTAKKSATSYRKIIDEYKKIPAKGLYSYSGSILNCCQKALQHIPVIGKPLEKIMPDAFQNVKLNCELSVTEEKKLIYWVGLIRTNDNKTLLVFRGEFLLA